ncbi:hypothetical protein SB49_02360 [Sediminicola sp. YIK13]|uniref:ATP-grasp domain-containing protein n=1 Tax=Sediminicola sp. YIK13 TaxID=1453352 RepID=UPI00071EB334|nr:ATP-grasp domain-containing protein [Sediminicola sp. YIK13]ALM06775.1 hypothetical protein SB49_02360 [Sediminicola sp. YIK13]
MKKGMSENKNSLSILIPDGEWVGLARQVKDCLSMVPDIKIYLMSNEKKNSIRYSRFVTRFIFYPKTNNEIEWISNINNELLVHKIDLIIPLWEDGIRSLIKYKELLTDSSKLVILPTLDMFDIANNKALLVNHLISYRIPGPRSVYLKLKEFKEHDEFTYPFLMKPIGGEGGGKGIVEFRSRNDFNSYFQENSTSTQNYLFQEFIKGYDIDCSVLCKNGIILAYTIQKGMLYNNKKYAPPIGLEFIHNNQLYAVVEKLMKSLNWSGIAHIDLRYDEIVGDFKVIEINTRFWGSTNASLIAGINFPELLCLTSLNLDFEVPHYRHIKFLSIDGLKWIIKSKNSNILNLKFIYNNTPLKYMARDPLPTIMGWLYKIESIIHL